MAERGDLDHATLNRWVEKYGGRDCLSSASLEGPNGLFLADGRNLCEGQRPIDLSVPRNRKGRKIPWFHAVGTPRRGGNDCLFFVKAIGKNGSPDKVVIDKSGWNGGSVQCELSAGDVLVD